MAEPVGGRSSPPCLLPVGVRGFFEKSVFFVVAPTRRVGARIGARLNRQASGRVLFIRLRANRKKQ